MKTMIGIAYSPLSDTIYAGKYRITDSGIRKYMHEKVDVTSEAVAAVLRHFIGIAQNGSYNISFDKKNIKITIEEEK